MALTIKKQVTPEVLSIPDDAVRRVQEVGGEIVLPEIQQYVRIGGIIFIKPRNIMLIVEFWPSQEAARSRDERHNPKQRQFFITPEPQVVQSEVSDSEGNVILPAIYTPTYDDLMSREIGGEVNTLQDACNVVRAKLYAWLKTWGNFLGAEDA